jgi:hypothetical protein
LNIPVSSARPARNALGAVRSSLGPRCIGAGTRLYLPMPFFWVGGFGSGVLSALLAAATLVTEPSPHPETTLRLLERERVTLFRGWPDRPARSTADGCVKCSLMQLHWIAGSEDMASEHAGMEFE